MQQHPEKIDKYQILSVLGKGAMGVVYHAFDPLVKRDVAIKFLSSLDIEEPELISRFEREARLAGGLRHPNIVTIYDLGHFQNRPYIVMEYILGKDLEAIIKEKQLLSVEQRLEIISQVCRGLSAAHSKGIIHRDIKPANIRIQEDQTVKIMDFGIARMGTSQLTRSGYIIGTLQYMSPEQISGEPLDPRTDIFSLGVIGYELFTNNNPFSGGSAVDIMYRILNLRTEAIQNLPEEFGTELNQIIARALEKNRELRYPNVREMIQDLDEILFSIKSVQLQARKADRRKQTLPGAQKLPLNEVPVTVTKPAEIPATVAMDLRSNSFPTFGSPQQKEKIPRTGLGANYSETAQQVLMKPVGTWQDRKFFIIGAFIALLFIGGLFYIGSRRTETKITEAVMIKSEPPGAEIQINGISVGKTPFTLTEKKDTQIIFRMAGYKDKQISLSPEAWPAQVNVILQKPASTIHKVEETPVVPAQEIVEAINVRIESNPSGATVLVDGKEMGAAPADITLPDAAPHQIRLQLEGYKPLEASIDKTSSPLVKFDLESVLSTGTVHYTGSYPIAVFSGGKILHGPTITLPEGTYKLSFVSKKGAFIRFTKTIEIHSGETISISQPPLGNLSVKANPSNCRISIDGQYVDDAPIFAMPVQAGTHVIQFDWTKLNSRLNKSVIINAGETQSVVGVPE